LLTLQGDPRRGRVRIVLLVQLEAIVLRRGKKGRRSLSRVGQKKYSVALRVRTIKEKKKKGEL